MYGSFHRRRLFPPGGPLGLGGSRLHSSFGNHLRWGAICTFSRQIGKSLFLTVAILTGRRSGRLIRIGRGARGRAVILGGSLIRRLRFHKLKGRVRAFQSGVAIRLIRRGAVIGLTHRGQQRTQIVTVRRRRRISRGASGRNGTVRGGGVFRNRSFLLQQYFFLGCHKINLLCFVLRKDRVLICRDDAIRSLCGWNGCGLLGAGRCAGRFRLFLHWLFRRGGLRLWLCRRGL